MLTREQIAFYHEHGYLRIPAVFTPPETDELANELDRLIREWASNDPGWTGPWRRVYMDAATEKKSTITAMHDVFADIHAWLTVQTLIVMLALHVGAVIKHHIFDKDPTLRRMLPRF